MPKSCAVNFPLTNVTQKLNYPFKFEYQFKQVAYSEQPIIERPIRAIKYTKLVFQNRVNLSLFA